MKRINKVLIILFMGIILTGCGSHKVYSIESFNNIIKNEKMAVYNPTKQLPSSAHIKEGSIGLNDNKWRIEYYIFDDEENAKKIYDDNQTLFAASDGINQQYKVNQEHYSKYYAITNKEYMFVSRVKNSVLFAKIDKQYQSDIERIINKMGY